MSSDIRFVEMAASLETLASSLRREALRRDINLDTLLDEYADMRHRLSYGISAISVERLPNAVANMRAALERIERHLWACCKSQIPIKKLKISGFTGIHCILLEFLVLHAGETVTGERLRFLTADQTHTERRVRELRELGYAVAATRTAGRDSYVLTDTMQKLDDAARHQAEILLARKSRSFDSIETSALAKVVKGPSDVIAKSV